MQSGHEFMLALWYWCALDQPEENDHKYWNASFTAEITVSYKKALKDMSIPFIEQKGWKTSFTCVLTITRHFAYYQICDRKWIFPLSTFSAHLHYCTTQQKFTISHIAQRRLIFLSKFVQVLPLSQSLRFFKAHDPKRDFKCSKAWPSASFNKTASSSWDHIQQPGKEKMQALKTFKHFLLINI